MKEHDVVRLRKAYHCEDGKVIQKGEHGTVVHLYNKHQVEVEFSRYKKVESLNVKKLVRDKKANRKCHYLRSDTHAILCNQNMGGASGWRHTDEPSSVTCGSCLRILKKGSIQLKLL